MYRTGGFCNTAFASHGMKFFYISLPLAFGHHIYIPNKRPGGINICIGWLLTEKATHITTTKTFRSIVMLGFCRKFDSYSYHQQGKYGMFLKYTVVGQSVTRYPFYVMRFVIQSLIFFFRKEKNRGGIKLTFDTLISRLLSIYL